MTQALLLERPDRMAKKPSRGSRDDRPAQKPVKIDADLHRDLDTLSAFDGKDMAELASELLRPLLRERMRKMAGEIARRSEQERTRRHGDAGE